MVDYNDQNKAELTEWLIKYGTEWVTWSDIYEIASTQFNESRKFIERKDSSVFTHMKFRITDIGLEYLK